MTELYKQAGVDIDAGAQAVNLMKQAIQATYTPSVLADVGSFGAVSYTHLTLPTSDLV